MANHKAIFPYPVLNELDNFQHPLPDDAALYYCDKDKKNYILQITLTINNREISQFLKEGKANYLIEVDCPSTFYRKVFKFSPGNLEDAGKAIFEIRIPKENLHRRVTVTCVVIAEENIPNYYSTDFNEVYYKNTTFNIDKGDILVTFRSFTFDTHIKPVEDSNLGDYIEFRESNSDSVSFDLDNIIYISLPQKIFDSYHKLDNVINLNSAIIHASLVNTALIEALHRITERPTSIWAQSLTSQLIEDPQYEEGKDYILNDNHEIIKIPNPVAVASKILEDPFSRMILGMEEYKSVLIHE